MSMFGRILGTAFQATVLGTLLFLAILKLAGIVGGARIFEYEGF